MPETPKEQPDQPRLDDLITLQQASEFSELSPSHLRLLVSSGELWGVKLGRNWFTTIQAVDEYQKKDRRPGPKPGKGMKTDPIP